MTFTESEFRALSQQSVAALQPQPAPSFPLSSRILLAVGAVCVGGLGLGAIAGIMQRPSQPQAVAPSPPPVAVASPSPVPIVAASPTLAPTHIVWGQPGDVLNIRKEKNGDIIGGIPAGTQITVTGVKDGWANVDYQGVSGVVSPKFLTSIGQGNSRP